MTDHPPSQPIPWRCVSRDRRSQVVVWAQRWWDARIEAAKKLGVLVDDVDVTRLPDLRLVPGGARAA